LREERGKPTDGSKERWKPAPSAIRAVIQIVKATGRLHGRQNQGQKRKWKREVGRGINA